MSFHIEFTAQVKSAAVFIEHDSMPGAVKAYIRQALTAFKPESLVYIKAVGHLYEFDNYNRSSADIEVHEVLVRIPMVPPLQGRAMCETADTKSQAALAKEQK